MADQLRDSAGRFSGTGGANFSVRVVFSKLQSFMEQLVKRVTLGCVANLVETTPVDTGWARANWVPNIGTATQAPAGARDAVTTAPQAQGIATVATSYKLAQGRIEIANNVPYIGKLNDGSSKQAPSGFVQIAILKAIQDAIKVNGS